MRLLLLMVVTALALTAPVPAQAGPGTAHGRSVVGLHTGWSFHRGEAPGAAEPGFDDSGWDRVTVPHSWNGRDGQDGGNDYYRGPGWYRRGLPAPAGGRVWLQFDGANTTTTVWVNGRLLGEHKGGYARFRFDATEALRPGQSNVLAVRVSNAPDPDVAPLSGDFTMHGGLYREVSLVLTDAVHLDLLDHGGPGLYLRQQRVTLESATVAASTKLVNDSRSTARVRLRATVTGAFGEVVAREQSSVRAVGGGQAVELALPLTIARPRRWQGRADPFRYQATVEVVDTFGRVLDRVSQPLGLRTAEISATDGFALNGQRLPVHGVNLHQDRPDVGWAVTPAQHAEDFRIMREMGVNAIRTAHYQHGETVYELADRHGFLVWTEIPLINLTTDSPAFRANIETQLREMIRQNFNHPSVVWWGLGNELWHDSPANNALLDRLAEVVGAEDPSRPSAYASCCVPDRAGITKHTNGIGYNKYFGWYTGTFAELGPWADQLRAADPARPLALSEYGAGASAFQHQENPPNPVPASRWHPEQYQSAYHEAYWSQLARRRWLWGSFVWAMFDFASDSRDEGDTPGRNDKGLVTYDRGIRKDAFYWYQANWTDTPVVHLNSKRWTSRTAASTTVRAYTNAETVTLRVNGRQVGGPISGASRVAEWPEVLLRPGPNTVEVSGFTNGRPHTDTAVWTLRE
ncbi:glycoside hydrolase family 2 TIM barrel-domain containing protein [Crossiella sp. NPDC003009]